MKNILTLGFILLSILSWADVHEIGSDKPFKSPNELYQASENGSVTISDGDTITIDAGEYRGTQALAIWRANNLYVTGKGGNASLYADGEYIIGKGIFVSAGNDITYEYIAFHDASVPDQNGAGIRLDGSGLSIRNCFFYNNENGILANNSENGRVLIEYSEFSTGGFGDGFSHNIYINHCASLTIQFCYFHDASIGHQIKSRADSTIIQYNRIADNTGNSSRLIDIPNGGYSLIMGNELIQGENAENNNLIGYGLEGLSNPQPHNIYVIHNTILNYRTASCLYFHVAEKTDSFLVANNILGGQCNLFSDKEAIMRSNLILNSTSEIQFIDEENLDINLMAGSLAIDLYEDLMDDRFKPAYEYVHPLSMILRETITVPDAGAHEGKIIISTKDVMNNELVFTNPVVEVIEFYNYTEGSFDIYQLDGKRILNGQILNNLINVSILEGGIYILRLENKESIKFVKL